MDATAAERLARNETMFREINERIRSVATDLGDDGHVFAFLCECSDPACMTRLHLTLAEYEDVRADPTRFALAPGHSRGDIEHVVGRRGDSELVEKDGVAAEVAAALDPRGDQASSRNE